MGLLDSLKIEQRNSPENAAESGDEFDDEFTPDPEPDERPANRRRSTGKTTAAPVKKTTPTQRQLAKEVAEDLASLLEGTAAVWGLNDQCCAPVLEQQARPIAEAFVKILARNPRLLAKFAKSDIAAYTLSSVALGKALLPVGKAVYKNHVSKADDSGQEGHQHGGDRIQLGNFPAYIPRN